MDDERGSGDLVLSRYYEAVTGQGGEFGVTLLVGGAWLTGVAISGGAWFEQLAHLVDTSSGGDHGLPFRHLGELIYPAGAKGEADLAEAPSEDAPVSFLHLRNARLLSGVAWAPTEGGLVRVRIERVDAWLFGSLGES